MVSLRAHTASRTLCLLLNAAPVILVLTILTSVCHAQNPIVRVEEDWEMVVKVPDVNSNGPQLACTFSPLSNLGSFYATFELNHCSSPDFASGGLHLHVWNGEDRVCSKAFPNARQLSIAGERVTWTQRMEIQDHKLLFSIDNGGSITWGRFGDNARLTAPAICWMTSLDDYTPEVSIKNSGVTYASNCVEKLVLTRVRATRADGSVTEVELNHSVHSSGSAN